MRESLFKKFIKRYKKLFVSSLETRILSTRRTRKLIPEEYFIEVRTTVPGRKFVVENYDKYN